MLRFGVLEELGLSVAAMSDRSDGDCRRDAEAAANRRRFAQRCGAAYGRLVSLRQMHGTRVVAAGKTKGDEGAGPAAHAIPEADGVITRAPGLPLTITAADCVPVFLFDPTTQTAGLVHAGRKGTLGNICRAAVQALRERYAVMPRNLHAVLGPSAGPCCYEVSVEVAAAFAEAGLPTRGRRLDLWAANRRQLTAAGIPPGNITLIPRCTICDGAFFSYRAQNTAKRNLALLMI